MENRLIHTVPTHIEVRDKIVLGLDFQQFTGLFIGMCITAALYNSLFAGLPLALKLAATGICAAITLLLVLLRPHGDSMSDWLFDRLLFSFSTRAAFYGLWELEETGREMSGLLDNNLWDQP